MNTPHKQESWKFVEAEKVVSKPGAKITVKELILTEKGLKPLHRAVQELRKAR